MMKVERIILYLMLGVTQTIFNGNFEELQTGK